MQKKFSFPVKTNELTQNKYHYTIEADSEELSDLTAILQVVAVKSFKGEIFLKLNKKENMLRVWGNVKALVVLQSVISLNDFEKIIDTPFELWFDTKATYQDIHDLQASVNDDIPDIIENNEINLADILIEQIALNLDNYPRAKGEVFNFSDYVKTESEESTESPFAILKQLKK